MRSPSAAAVFHSHTASDWRGLSGCALVRPVEQEAKASHTREASDVQVAGLGAPLHDLRHSAHPGGEGGGAPSSEHRESTCL